MESMEQRILRSAKSREFEQTIRLFRQYEMTQKPSIRCQLAFGMALAQKQRYEESISAYQKAIDSREADLQNRVWLYISMGMAYNKMDKPKEAIEAFNKIEEPEKLESKAYQAFFTTRGHVYYGNGQYQKALADFDACLSKYPESEKAAILKVETYLVIGEEDEAEEVLERLEKITGKTAKTHSKKAWIYHIRKEYKNEVEERKKVVEINPRDAQAFFKMGLAQSILGQQEEAEKSFQKYIELKDNSQEALSQVENAKKEGKSQAQMRRCTAKISGAKDQKEKMEAYMDRAKAYIERGDSNFAAFDYRAVTELKLDQSDPKNREAVKQAWNCLGNISQSWKDFQGAIWQYSQAIEVDQFDTEAIFNRGLSNLREGERVQRKMKDEARKGKSSVEKKKHEKLWINVKSVSVKHQPKLLLEKMRHLFAMAIQDFTKIIELNKGQYCQKFTLSRGKVFLKNQQYSKAIDDFNLVLSNDNNAEAAFLKGVAFYYLENYSEALQLCKRGKEMEEYRSQAFQVIGNSYRKSRKYQQALENYDLVIKLDENNQEVYCKRGFILLKRGKYEKAVGQFDSALKVNPGNASALFGRAKAYEQTGLLMLSVQDYKAAVENDKEHIFCLASLASMNVNEQGSGSFKTLLFKQLKISQIEEIKQKYDLSNLEKEGLSSSLKSFWKKAQTEQENPLSNILLQQIVVTLSLFHLPEPEQKAKLQVMKNPNSQQEMKVVQKQEHAQ